MADQLGVDVVFLRQGELEHDQLILRQTVQLSLDRSFQELLGLGFFGAVNVDFRLDDRHETGGDDLPSDFELLAHDGLDAGSAGLLDERAHLGSKDPLRGGLVEQGRQVRYRLQELNTAALRCQALVHLQKRHDPLHVPEIVRCGFSFDVPVDGVLEQDGADDPIAGESRARDDACAHLMHELEHLLLVGPCAVLDSVRPQRAGRAAAALIQRGDESGLRPHLLQLSLEVAHVASHRVASFRIRYRRMRVFVELSWSSLGSVGLSSSGMICWASTLPSSTPHWSNESTSQMMPCVNTLCSYSATSLPSVSGVSRSARIVFEGRLPRKTRWGTTRSGVPSALTCSRVLPKASASVCANTLAMSMSW